MFKPKIGGETGPESTVAKDHQAQGHLDTLTGIPGASGFDNKPYDPLPTQTLIPEGADNTALGRIEIPV